MDRKYLIDTIKKQIEILTEEQEMGLKKTERSELIKDYVKELSVIIKWNYSERGEGIKLTEPKMSLPIKKVEIYKVSECTTTGVDTCDEELKPIETKVKSSIEEIREQLAVLKKEQLKYIDKDIIGNQEQFNKISRDIIYLLAIYGSIEESKKRRRDNFYNNK